MGWLFMNVGNLIGDFICEVYGIDDTKEYEIEYIEAKKLLVSNRLDLIAKYKYVEMRDEGTEIPFIMDLYKKHIEAITCGSCSEWGNDNKNSLEKYIGTFDELIQSIKKSGVDSNISVIPVGVGDAILDGAHRVAIAAYYNLTIPIVRIENITAVNDAEFFKNNLLSDEMIEYLVTEYCKIAGDTYAVCFWPKATDNNKRKIAEKLINDVSHVVYKKELDLSFNGIRNLMIQIYCTHDWMGDIDKHFPGASDKADWCYDANGKLTLFIIEGCTLTEVLKLKEGIRNIFNLQNHSVHITDTKRESIQIANLLMNKNSVDLLEKGKPDLYVPLNMRISLLKDKIIKSGLSLEECLIDSSTILGLYGVRNVNDLDFLTSSGFYRGLEDIDIENHEDWVEYYGISKHELIYNPDNFLYYNELKFVSLQRLRTFKVNRNEDKDKFDIKLIDSCLSGKKDFKTYYYKFSLSLKIYKRKIRLSFYSTIKKSSFYKPLRNAYHQFKK